ncbi:integrase/recombinase xerD homolog [Amphiura filiformis]|uniref:integrase/recombinase xerD homolog n=1 Tax=Amphiura filiformis TaxID=82378 RepID=UPI003B21237C
MDASRAESTVKKYKHAIATWEVWCRLNKVNSKEAVHEDIARYFIHMFNDNAPYSRIETAFFAIKWHFNCCLKTCMNNPCETRFLQLLMDGLKRLLAKPADNRKEPITADNLRSIIDKFNQDNLKDLRLCTMMLVAYAGFLRYDELSNIKVCDLELCDSHVKIFIEKSKTDQLREGAWVIIGATGKSTCPVAMLRRYMECAGFIGLDISQYLFTSITMLKSQNKYVVRSRKLSYSRCREILKEALGEIGLDASKFGVHSLRAGGASAAAAFGVPDRLFKRHGRWKSDSSKDRYVKETMSNKLLVSMNLGI